MKIFKNHIVIVLGILCWICLHQSCTHDPLFDDMEVDPIDTMTNPLDTMGMDSTDIENPCDSNIVYFKNDILPILVSNCALSGCHDAETATEGVILDNYDNIINTGDIEPSDLDSKLYEIITETNPNKVMPPEGKLDDAQINLIASWINLGAVDSECDEVMEPCAIEQVSYSEFVVNLMLLHCNGCHASGVASGGIITDNYEDLKVIANNGRLYGAINWESGFEKMPQGLDQLDKCDLDKIKSWIDAGAENN